MGSNRWADPFKHHLAQPMADVDHVRLWLLHGTSGTTLDLWSVVGAAKGQRLLREEIGHTVATDDTIDEEIQYLFRALKT